MTTRSKGTGLGLAIVKKIMEDHGGWLTLDDREGGGARISLVFRATPRKSRRTTARDRRTVIPRNEPRPTADSLKSHGA